MNNYWINVMATAHSVSGTLSIILGILSVFLLLTEFVIGQNDLFKHYYKSFTKIIIGVIITFVFLILTYIFTSPIN